MPVAKCLFVFVGALFCETLIAQESHSLASAGKSVMTYNALFVESPDADQPWYGRSGFIHPVYTPSGRVVTDGFPTDHLHQHGLMFAWTSAVVNGRKVDFWNSKKQVGVVEHVETTHADSEKIVVQLQHIDRTSETPAIALKETWEIQLVSHPSMNVFDLVSTQNCVTELFEIKEYHYGAMCIRGSSEWLKDATMVTNEGKHRIEGNHSRPNYVTLSGVIDGETCGIAAMSHPDNFRAPQPVRLHSKKPYFCFAPMILGDFRIDPEEPYVSIFRFVAFDGEPQTDELDAIWQQYTETTSMKIETHSLKSKAETR